MNINIKAYLLILETLEISLYSGSLQIHFSQFFIIQPSPNTTEKFIWSYFPNDIVFFYEGP